MNELSVGIVEESCERDTVQVLPTIEPEEVLSANVVLRTLTQTFGFHSPWAVLRMALLILIPFAVFLPITLRENRFWLGSVTTPLSGGASEGSRFLGMSFLGDTMVWPFFILVPGAIVALSAAANSIARFFSDVRPLVRRRYAETKSKRFSALVERARDDLAERGRWRYGRYVALFIGLAFWSWNSFACTFPETVHPYRARRVVVVSTHAPREIRVLEAPIPLAKWDTDRTGAHMSWTAARVWVLFGYGFLPLIIFKLVNLATVLYRFCAALSRDSALEIMPLAPDGAGGLSSLSRTALRLIYGLLPFSIMLALSLLKEAAPPSPHNYVLICGFLPVFFLVFFLPLSAVHASMRASKDAYLGLISTEFNRFHRAFLQKITEEQVNAGQLKELEEIMECLRRNYERINAMPVWPFDMKTLVRFGASLGAPLVPLVLQKLLSGR